MSTPSSRNRASPTTRRSAISFHLITSGQTGRGEKGESHGWTFHDGMLPCIQNEPLPGTQIIFSFSRLSETLLGSAGQSTHSRRLSSTHPSSFSRWFFDVLPRSVDANAATNASNPCLQTWIFDLEKAVDGVELFLFLLGRGIIEPVVGPEHPRRLPGDAIDKHVFTNRCWVK